MTTPFMREAYQALREGDLEGTRQCYDKGRSAASPVMLDLSGDGKRLFGDQGG